MKRNIYIMHDPKRKAWWVVMNDGYHVMLCKSPREARHKKRMWYLYLNEMNEARALEYLTRPCPPKRITCPVCEEKVFNVRTWRTNTAFTDDRLNYMECCYACITENDEMRHHDWNSYYGVSGVYVSIREFKPRSKNDYVK